MKKTINKTMFVILATLGVVSTSLMGQTRSAIRMKIPFTFVAGEKVLPAGEYTIQTGGSVQNSVWIRSEDASKNLVLLSHSTQPQQVQGESWLRFHRYGDRYFLSQILIDGNGTGQELPRSHAEREYIASQGMTQQVVTLVARR
jgi:hypothetical protein